MLGNDYALKLCLVTPILALKGKGKFINRPTSTGGKKYDKHFIYIPTAVAKDSQFPFKSGETISITVDSKKRRVVIESGTK